MSATCKDCGAPLEGRVTSSGVVACRYCGATHDVHHLAAQARRTLIAAADFSGPTITGWIVGPRLVGKPVAGPPAAWSVSMDNDDRVHPLLWAPASLDDFDVTLAVRFVSNQPGDSVFIKARGAPAGAVTLHFWMNGAVALRWMQPDDAWKEDIASATPPKPKAEGGWRRLRWVAVGARHRVHLDGALVLSATHEPIRHSGHLDVRMRMNAPSATVELAELAVFEPSP